MKLMLFGLRSEKGLLRKVAGVLVIAAQTQRKAK